MRFALLGVYWSIALALPVPADPAAPLDPAASHPAVESSGAVPSSDPLVVTRFWYPWRYTSAPLAYYYGGIVATDGQYVWQSVVKPPGVQLLVRIDPTDFLSQLFPDPAGPSSNGFSFAAAPDALYAVGETHGHDGSGGPLAHEIARLDPTTGTWIYHPIPDCFAAKIYAAGTALYLFLSSNFAGNEDVIDRYDWDTQAVTVLASTRRRPAQNQFDNRERLLNAQVFAGPAGKPCVTTADGTFYIEDKPGPWPEVFDGARDSYAASAGAATLVVGGAGEVVLLDPHASEAVPLMRPIESYFRRQPEPGKKPAKSFPSWAANAPWDAPTHSHFYYTDVAYHRDALFILKSPATRGGDYNLLCYQRGKGRGPRVVPLQFHLDDRARADMALAPAGAPVAWRPEQLEHPDTTVYPGPGVHLICTDSGICIEPLNLGFWYLPYPEIEAYLDGTPN